jgi:hypothetical protein
LWGRYAPGGLMRSLSRLCYERKMH